MSYFSWLRSRTSYRAPRNRALQRSAAPRLRPQLEALEDRTLLSNYTAATTSDLIHDIKAANNGNSTSTITLAANTTFDLTQVDNTTNGANGLPVVKKIVTITGQGGDVIQRDSAAPAFRLFDVAGGGSLTLENVTLQGGLAFGSGTAADGGAIYNQGSLTLIGATVEGNTAQGSNGDHGVETDKQKKGQSLNGQAGANAEGGGIWSSGSVTLQGGTLIGTTDSLHTGNEAIGGQGGAAGYSHIPGVSLTVGNGGAGGEAFGGGLYEAGGSVTVTSATLSANEARGGAGGDNSVYGSQQRAAAGAGGAASGGGLFVADGTLDMIGNPQNSTLVTVESNKALGGDGGNVFLRDAPGQGGEGSGGGISLADPTTATLAYVELLQNTAQGGNGGVTASRHSGDAGGSAFGGGLYVANGAVTFTNDIVNSNDAVGGWGKSVGGNTDFSGHSVQAAASGGGIYIVGGKVSLDLYTVDNTNGNYLDNDIFYENDIVGPYTLI